MNLMIFHIRLTICQGKYLECTGNCDTFIFCLTRVKQKTICFILASHLAMFFFLHILQFSDLGLIQNCLFSDSESQTLTLFGTLTIPFIFFSGVVSL